MILNKALIDRHGRQIKKLRVSLTDACNFNCFYCRPEGHKINKRRSLLTPDEIANICSKLVELGIEQIRLTGGEPTLRKEFFEIVQRLSALPLKKLGFTTNGSNIQQHLMNLTRTDCRYINFSIDSLNEKKFQMLTGQNQLRELVKSIQDAIGLGFKVKCNVVLMRGLNDEEIYDFAEFAAKHQVELRFLEVMKIGVARENFDKWHISVDDVIKRLKDRYELKSVEKAIDSTSFNYKLSNGANVGFIASESKPFCGNCSRLRLTADGMLMPCLMMEDGIDLKNVSPHEYEKHLQKLIGMKPTNRLEEVDHDMFTVGG